MADQFSSSVDETKFSLNNVSLRNRCCCTLEEYYEVEKCVKCIKDNNYNNVSLQFPDWQLCDAPVVSKVIEEQAKCKTYILADTSYGSCCVDETTADHVKADLIIHFGPSCLSLTQRIPVLYIFGQESIDISHCCQSFQSLFTNKDSKILIIYEVFYNHAIAEVYSRLASDYKYLVRSYLNCPSPENQCCTREACCCKKMNVCCKEEDNKYDGCGHVETVDQNDSCCCFMKKELSIKNENNGSRIVSRFGRIFTLAEHSTVEDYTVFYIGQESLTLTNHIMSYNKSQFFTYNPESNICREETINVNRMLMRRYYLIERAKDSNVVGILIGTLGINDYLMEINRLKKLIRRAGKKYYTFVIGKLNPEKLANFMEIDIFVLVACPENSLINSKDFYKPIITPFEIEIACTSARDWTGEYITDFQELLPGARYYVDIDNTVNDKEDITDISLISGQIRHIKSPSNEEMVDTECNHLATRNNETSLVTHKSAAEFLEKRSWKGLDARKGENPVVKAVEGTDGIASEYRHENGTKNHHA